LSGYYTSIEPIFTVLGDDNNLLEQEKLPKELRGECIVDDEENNFIYCQAVNGRKKVVVNEILTEAAKNVHRNQRPIVFLVVCGVPHAMIYIIHENTLYTVGFGYNDQHKNGIIKDALRKSDNPIMKSIAHSIEVLNGSLYSADYLMPELEQIGKIVWIDYLDENILHRIQDELNHSTAVMYNGTYKSNRNRPIFELSQNCTVMVQQKYCEAAGFMHNGTTNCIRWALQILDIRLNCGFLQNPMKCKEVNEEQFNLFKENFLNPGNLETIINNIQQRLTPKICNDGNCTISGGRKNMNRKTIRKK
jgi:hypothetical protein